MVELALSRVYSDVILSASEFCIFGSINELRDEHSTGGVSVLPRDKLYEKYIVFKQNDI